MFADSAETSSPNRKRFAGLRFGVRGALRKFTAALRPAEIHGDSTRGGAPLAVRRGLGNLYGMVPQRVFPPFLRAEKWGRSRRSEILVLIRRNSSHPRKRECSQIPAKRPLQNANAPLVCVLVLREFTPSVAFGASVSLRLGHAAALTCPRHVIHSRGVASLPQGGRLLVLQHFVPPLLRGVARSAGGSSRPNSAECQVPTQGPTPE